MEVITLDQYNEGFKVVAYKKPEGAAFDPFQCGVTMLSQWRRILAEVIQYVNDQIFFWGYPGFGGKMDTIASMMEGYISSVKSSEHPGYLEANIYSVPGCSGSPVFKSENGKFYLIGIISSANVQTTIITPIKEALKTLKL